MVSDQRLVKSVSSRGRKLICYFLFSKRKAQEDVPTDDADAPTTQTPAEELVSSLVRRRKTTGDELISNVFTCHYLIFVNLSLFIIA